MSTDDERRVLAARFEDHRVHLHAVAYRMLGSVGEADDAVQETWLRLDRSDPRGIENLGGWLTTVTARIALDMLRSRHARREELAGPHVPDPVVSSLATGDADPEHEALLADSVGLALLVVLETLSPAERLAFVLHDTFGLAFEEIAGIVDRSPAAARQLASRARRRVRAAPRPDADLARQRPIVEAFLAAAREGDFDALVALLDPDVVLRADTGALGSPPSRELRGADAVAGGARTFRAVAAAAAPALVNGAPGFVAVADGRPTAVASFTIVGDRIVEIDILADPERLRRLDLGDLAGG